MNPAPPSSSRRRLVLAAGASLALGACATGPRQAVVEVEAHGSWPAGRKAGSYAFERLPSQLEDLPAQQALEDAARPALSLAGFGEGPAESAEFLVQLGLRLHQVQRPGAYDPFFDDPFFYPGWGGPYYRGWRGSRVGVGGSLARGRRSSVGLGLSLGGGAYVEQQREAALLIRERRSGQVLHELRARLAGGGERVVPLLFEAALKDFPQAALRRRQVTVLLPPG